MYDVLSKKKINMIYNLDNRQYLNISLAGKYIGWVITDGYGKEIENYSGIFNIKARSQKVSIENLAGKTDKTNSDNGYQNSNQVFKGPNVTLTDVLIGDCRNNTPKNSHFFSIGNVFQSAVCIDLGLNNISLTGKVGAIDGYSIVNIFLNKCVNSTKNGNNCLPQANIDKVLEYGILNIFMTEHDVNS